ncbi:hypothetical protein Gpo141_00005695 [Globisporangium polare]
MTIKQQARKLRLLCLHGMYQNADTFAAKTKHLRALQCNEDFVEYIYLDGPFTVTPRILAKQNQHGSPPPPQQQHMKKHSNASSSQRPRCAKTENLFRAWWRPSGPHQSEPTQLDQDRDVLLSFLRTQLSEIGEVDGVLGFSQGASLASWLCSAQARLELRWSPKLAILIGSYLGPQQYSLDSGILSDTSSLHMFGVNDHVISAAKSQAVVDVFTQSQDPASSRHVQTRSLIHSQGHVIPKCDAALAQYHSFLAQNLPSGISVSSSSSTSASSSSPGSSSVGSTSKGTPNQPQQADKPLVGQKEELRL